MIGQGPSRPGLFMIGFLSSFFFWFFLGNSSWGQDKASVSPVKVTIQDEKAVVFEPVLPMDSVRRIDYQSQPNMGIRLTVEGKALHLGYIYTILKIDDRIQAATQAEVNNARLPKNSAGKDRDGFFSVYNQGQIRITQTAEVVPTKAVQGGQRRRDSVMIRYTLENKDTQVHKVGMRLGMDVYLVDNDGALFAAPNHPNRILDGVELKDKMVPDFLQVLQRPDLKNPGFVAHFTFGLGSSVERPSRVILTSLGAGTVDNWNLQVMPANGDSAMSIYWDPKEIKPGGKRELAYAYGQGIAGSLENEANVKVDLGGSFEPGKLFTVAAFVSDPAPGQSLTLELPPGMVCMEGKEIQPVPPMDADGNCMVFWKARVLQPGQYTLRVHSNTGVTQSKIITITR